MNFDLPSILVYGSALTGSVWLIDSLFFAKKRQSKKLPIAVDYAKAFFPILFIVLILRSFVFEPFRIPSGSMLPTLLIGDFILVNKFSYGLRLPVLNKKVVEIGDPERGDVVVFRYPREPNVDYIKRVVAVGGDKVEYKAKILYVNGIKAEQQPVGYYTGIGGGIRATGSAESKENLFGVEHNLLTRPHTPVFAPGCSVLTRGPYVVPDNHYFVMGDNRDNSNDSRCWGVVPDANLVGKAFAVWFNFDSQRGGFPVGWGRIGTVIN